MGALTRSIVTAAFCAVLAGPAFGFDLQGHRGARGLYPENTLPAFAAALGIGVTTLELDTVIARDGWVMVTHDPALNPNLVRMEDGNWLLERPAVISLDLAQLKAFDVGRLKPGSRYAKRFPDQQAIDGTKIPKLAEVFELVTRAGNDRVRFNIETKLAPTRPEFSPEPAVFVRALLAEIDKAGLADRVSLQSFDWRTLQIAQKLAPHIPTVYLTAQQDWLDNLRRGEAGPSQWTAGFDIDDYGGSPPRLIKAAGGKVWSPYHRDLSDEDLAEAKRIGLAVIVWTVNRAEDMAALIDRGVDGIISDRPDILRQVMAEKGLPLPTPTPVSP